MWCMQFGRAVLLTAVVGLVGCGQTDPAPDTAPAPDTSVVEQPAVEPPTITGVVESTDPADFGTRTTSRQTRPWQNLLISPAYAEVVFVGINGVPVRAYPLDNTGYLYGPPIATTTTATAGDYTLVMPTTYAYQPKTEYVVVAGGPVIEDRIDDWGDLGEDVLRRLVTGVVGQTVSPVSEVVFRELIPAAQTQYIDVHTIPAVQVDEYHTYVQNQMQVLEHPGERGLRNAIAHIERNLARKQDRIAHRDAIFVSATRLSEEQRRDLVRRQGDSRPGNSGGKPGNAGKPDNDSSPGNSGGKPGNAGKPDNDSSPGNSGGKPGNAGKPDNDSSPGNSGGGQGNADKPKGNAGGNQGNASPGNSGSHEGNANKPSGGADKGGGKR